MAVQDELRCRCRARREIEQKRIVRAWVSPSGVKPRRSLIASFVGKPARQILADGDAGIISRQIVEFGMRVGGGNNVADAAAGKAIGEIVAASSIVAGTITAPSFIAASMVSQSGATLPSISRMRSPRRTPDRAKALAMRFERSLSSAKESLVSPAPSSTSHSAGARCRAPSARNNPAPS